MIAAAVNAKALQTYMGDASISITLDRYGRLMPGSAAEPAGLPISRPNRNGQPLECASLRVQSMAFRFWMTS
jgi:hypothetical protein